MANVLHEVYIFIIYTVCCKPAHSDSFVVSLPIDFAHSPECVNTSIHNGKYNIQAYIVHLGSKSVK